MGGIAEAIELDRLVREQAREIAAEGLPSRPSRRATLEADLASRPSGDVSSLDLLPDPKAVEPSAEASRREWFARHRDGKTLAHGEVRPVYLVGLDATWTADVVRFDPSKGPCPLCHGKPPRRSACACCNATADNPYPHRMQPPRPRGEAWDGTDYHTEPPLFLLGGLEGLARAVERGASRAGKPTGGAPRKARAAARPKAPPKPAAKARAARRAAKKAGKVALRVLQPIGSHRPGETIRVRETIAVSYIRAGLAMIADQPGAVGA